MGVSRVVKPPETAADHILGGAPGLSQDGRPRGRLLLLSSGHEGATVVIQTCRSPRRGRGAGAGR